MSWRIAIRPELDTLVPEGGVLKRAGRAIKGDKEGRVWEYPEGMAEQERPHLLGVPSLPALGRDR